MKVLCTSLVSVKQVCQVSFYLIFFFFSFFLSLFFVFLKIKLKFFILAATDLQWKYGVQRVLSIGTKVSFLSIKIDKGQKACSCNWLEGEEAAVEFLRPKLKATMCILRSGLKWRRCHRILGRSWNGPRIKAKNCFYFSRKKGRLFLNNARGSS